MKKTMFLLIAMILVLGLTACGNAAAQKPPATTAVQPRPTPPAAQPAQKPPATSARPPAAAPVGARFAPTIKTISGVKIDVSFNSTDYCLICLTNGTAQNKMAAGKIWFYNKVFVDPKNNPGAGVEVHFNEAYVPDGFPKFSLGPGESWQTRIQVPKGYAATQDSERNKVGYRLDIYIGDK